MTQEAKFGDQNIANVVIYKYIYLGLGLPGSCTSELHLKVNCRPKVNCKAKVNCRIEFGLVHAWQTRPNFFLQFNFSCNSVIHVLTHAFLLRYNLFNTPFAILFRMPNL